MGPTQPPPSPNSASAAQLHRELLDAAYKATGNGRVPILTHLNADTSWLLQLPYPTSALPASGGRGRGGRIYYNILIDPWLRGAQVDIGSWFSRQWHATESWWRRITEVEELIREREEDVLLARSSGCVHLEAGTDRMVKQERAKRQRETGKSMIDAVIVSHEFTDHCHRETLLEVDRDVPVFASKKAAALIRAWKHFTTVQEIPAGKNPRSIMKDSKLPYWIVIDRLTSREATGVDLHSAILITFESDHGDASCHEDEPTVQGIVYTPHGIYAEQIPQMKPRIDVLALLHGLHDITIGGWRGAQLNLGGHNGLRAHRLLKAKYWIGTHDEVKKSGGVIGVFLRRKLVTVKEALEKEVERRQCDGVEADIANIRDVRFIELGNGESIALE